jgi:hypothetical protein
MQWCFETNIPHPPVRIRRTGEEGLNYVVLSCWKSGGLSSDFPSTSEDDYFVIAAFSKLRHAEMFLGTFLEATQRKFFKIEEITKY